jgi:thiol-disulfide isomerase/thioredoxin
MLKLSTFVIFSACMVSLSCRPAAAPVSISNRPVTANDRTTSKSLDEMAWTAEDGSTQKLASFSGKVLILDFWATYCPPCRDEIPHLNQLQARYGTEKVQVLGMHSGGDEDRPKIPDFRRQTRIDYPLAFPDDDLIDFVFANDSRIPQTIVIDRNGHVKKKIVGFSDEIGRELDSAVESAVNN